MKTLIAALIGQRKNPRVVAAALLAAGAIGGWAMSTTITANATAFRIEAPREKLQLEASKPSLIGSYVVTGTDSDGNHYAGAGNVGIALAPSGALELEWDNGKQIGVGEVIRQRAGGVLLEQGPNRNPDDEHQPGWFANR